MYVRFQSFSCKEQNKNNMGILVCSNIHTALHFAQTLLLSCGVQVEHEVKC